MWNFIAGVDKPQAKRQKIDESSKSYELEKRKRTFLEKWKEAGQS
jgi:hypothetical protein